MDIFQKTKDKTNDYEEELHDSRIDSITEFDDSSTMKEVSKLEDEVKKFEEELSVTIEPKSDEPHFQDRESITSLSKMERIKNLKRIVDSPKFIDGGDLVPFAWTHPLVMTNSKKISKVLKTITEQEKERSLLFPARTEQ